MGVRSRARKRLLIFLDLNVVTCIARGWTDRLRGVE